MVVGGEGESPPFLPWAFLRKWKDFTFVHYQTKKPEQLQNDSSGCAASVAATSGTGGRPRVLLQRLFFGLPLDVAGIRSRQEDDAVELAQIHSEDEQSLVLYRHMLRRWPYLTILVRKRLSLPSPHKMFSRVLSLCCD